MEKKFYYGCLWIFLLHFSLFMQYTTNIFLFVIPTIIGSYQLGEMVFYFGRRKRK
jgi:hypothetical protein